MKKRKKLIKRIGAVLCALVVAVSCLGMSGAYSASQSRDDILNSLCAKYGMGSYDFYEDYVYYAVEVDGCLRIWGHPSNSVCGMYYRYANGEYALSVVHDDWANGKNCSDMIPYHNIMQLSQYNVRETSGTMGCHAGFYTISNNHFNILFAERDVLYAPAYSEFEGVFFSANFKTFEFYNSSLGYLQNVSRKSTYIRGALYNYDEDSLTYHWYHDLTSSSGVDLTSGDYKIRHYISKATVKGYEKEDIIEMSDKYLMAEYDASQGYFSYLDKDYEESIRNQGYEDIDLIDKYLRGYFVLEHSYFQIVNTATNEVGGYLHLYPKDANSDEFGVEMVYEGLDDNFDVDESLQGGIIDDSTGSGTNVEDALENADEPKLDDLSGVEEFISVVKAYGVEVENVSNGVGALLGQFPPWVLGVLGLSFALMFIGVIICAMKG